MSKTSVRGILKRKPRIGITMRYSAVGDFYLRKEYSEALEAFGGVPVHISLIAKKEYLESVLTMLDGVLLPGSDSDVDPLLFGEEPRLGLGRVLPRRDQADLLVIQAAEQMQLPIFGICYGMQILNVARGGSLIQDIPSEIPNALAHQQGEPRNRLSHSVTLAQNSRLQSLIKQEKVLVNSHHHQSISALGNNLTAVAHSSDGVIEAVEDVRDERFALGVQWHPELNWEDDLFAQNIFAAFLTAAERRANSD